MLDNNFSDEYIDIPLENGIILERSHDDRPCTNVPHLVTHHSPSGFEFGYTGSGPADLALNVIEYYLRALGYKGPVMKCFSGECFRASWVLHHDFKSTFISRAERDINAIAWLEVTQWIDFNMPEGI